MQLQRMVQRAVQTVDWTYSLFWQLCPQERVLVWRDGYYNGAIKTRKTMLASEGCPEEEAAALQRSHQLRQLYHILSAGEAAADQQSRIPSAALCPEDLTESEWFYLLCISFSFPPGSGLPGRAYEQRQYVWLTGANEVDTKAFTRAILAKSARIQTVLCIPLLDGVVELGTVDRVGEDIGLVQEIINIFSTTTVNNEDGDRLLLQQVPKPALSEHSSTSFNYINKMSSMPTLSNDLSIDIEDEDNDNEEEDDSNDNSEDMEVEPDKLIQLDDMSAQDIRVGSPEYSSSHLSIARAQPLMKTSEEEDRFSQTVSTVLQHQYSSIGAPYSNLSSTNSAFNKWWPPASSHHRGSTPAQRALKYMLFTVPALHNSDSVSWKPSQQEELTSTNHVQAERRRREKLNERLITLRSLVPFVTRMDKASILGDTIEYVKQLQEKIQELEAKKEQINTTGELRKMRVLKGIGGGEEKIQVEVSIIEGDGLVELRCPHREGVLLEVMQRLRELKVETMMVQSTISHGIFVAELRAKVKENSSGKRATISEVKRAIHQIIPVARCSRNK